MKNNFDYIVIGNGSVGNAIGFEIKRKKTKNSKLAIIGPFNREGSASLAAGAMMNIFAEVEYDTFNTSYGRKKFEMFLKTRKMWSHYIKELSNVAKKSLKIRKGTFVLNNSSADALDDENFNSIIKALERYNESFQYVENKDIKGYSPNERIRSLRTIFIPNENFFPPSDVFLKAYDAAFKRDKTIELIDSKVLKINIKNHSLKEVLDENGKRYFTKNLIIAAGAYSENLIKQLSQIKNKIPDLFFGSGNAIIGSTENSNIPEHVIRTPNRGMACGLHMVPLNKKNIYVGATNRISHVPLDEPILSGMMGMQNSLIKEINPNLYRLKKLKVIN